MYSRSLYPRNIIFGRTKNGLNNDKTIFHVMRYKNVVGCEPESIRFRIYSEKHRRCGVTEIDAQL